MIALSACYWPPLSTDLTACSGCRHAAIPCALFCQAVNDRIETIAEDSVLLAAPLSAEATRRSIDVTQMPRRSPPPLSSPGLARCGTVSAGALPPLRPGSGSEAANVRSGAVNESAFGSPVHRRQPGSATQKPKRRRPDPAGSLLPAAGRYGQRELTSAAGGYRQRPPHGLTAGTPHQDPSMRRVGALSR